MIFFPDPCAANDCDHGAKCRANADDTAVCHCDEMKCLAKKHPVCGSDGVTYDNECKMKRVMCLEQRPITVKKKGECSK